MNAKTWEDIPGTEQSKIYNFTKNSIISIHGFSKNKV